MSRPAAPDRTVVTLRLLQAGCALLVAASLVALGHPSPAIVGHDGTATVASAYPAVPTEWSNGGPLAIPTIGVVPAGTADWFDPTAAPTLVPLEAPLSTLVLPFTEVPASGTDEPPPAVAGTSPPAPSAPATDSEPAPRSEAPTTDGRSTSPPQSSSPPATTQPPTQPPTTPSATTGPPATEEPPPTPPAPETNERGNVVLALGDELTVFDGDTGAAALAISVESVAVGVACAGPANAPAANGSFVALLLRVTTDADLSAVGGEPSIAATDFRFLGADGALLEAGSPSAASCVVEEASFPTGPLAADRELSGVVVLDVPATTGTIVFVPPFLTVGAEWTYGPPAAG